DDAHSGEQFGAVRLQAGGQGGQAGTGDSRRTLGRDDHEHEQRDLLGNRHRHAHGGGQEQRGHSQVDGGAVEVERVAGGYGDADARLRDSGMLQLRDQTRQGRFRRRGGEDEQELTGQVLQQQEDVQPGDDL